MARSRSRARSSSTALARPAPQRETIVLTAANLVPSGRRGGGGFRRRASGLARRYATQDRGAMGIVRHVGGLSGGGAFGSLAQGTVQGLGIVGPLWSKVGVVAAAVALGTGAARGSWTDKFTDGMIASAGSGAIFDFVAWVRKVWNEKKLPDGK